MGFNTKKYSETRWQRRTEEYPISNKELISLFEKDDKHVWTLQSLTGTELGLAEEASANRKLTTELMEALLEGRKKELIEHIKKLSGNVDEHPTVVVKKLYQFWYGMQDPEGSLDFAIDLCRQHPTEFFDATIKIMLLSGQGMTPGKSQPSGVTKESKKP